MHEYYAANNDKFRKGMDGFLSLVAPELEKASGKKYAEVFEEIWDYYEKHLLERFPYLYYIMVTAPLPPSFFLN